MRANRAIVLDITVGDSLINKAGPNIAFVTFAPMKSVVVKSSLPASDTVKETERSQHYADCGVMQSQGMEGIISVQAPGGTPQGAEHGMAVKGSYADAGGLPDAPDAQGSTPISECTPSPSRLLRVVRHPRVALGAHLLGRPSG